MTLSAYELERLANIRRNEEVLKALGLSGNNSLKPVQNPKKTKPRVSAPFVPEEERRRSSRVSQEVVHFQALSDQFCLAEERELRRPISSRKRDAPQNYLAEQQQEIEERENKARARREAAARCAAEAARETARQAAVLVKQQAGRLVTTEGLTTLRVDGISNRADALYPVKQNPTTPCLPVVDDCALRPPHQYAYPTLSQRARCPRCHGLFVITAAGTLHKHACRAVREDV